MNPAIYCELTAYSVGDPRLGGAENPKWDVGIALKTRERYPSLPANRPLEPTVAFGARGSVPIRWAG